ncbi:hypothetical protein E2C01_076884 [Portunus trituberculatus]|uniref:Uncharacterized protein n=1 Tax=Portunus trituberculatus TaxID=210409 RepID=A0A5B7IEC0_PORTR|nr:hypothetical protein [Portunus trituberculatus]
MDRLHVSTGNYIHCYKQRFS